MNNEWNFSIIKEKNEVSSYELWEVQKITRDFYLYISIESQSYTYDGVLHSKLLLCVERYNQQLISDFVCHIKTKQEVINTIKAEQKSIMDVLGTIVAKTIGLAAGSAQLVTGFELLALVLLGGPIATISAAIGAAFIVFVGVGLIAHGANNAYQSKRYFVDGEEDALGFTRKLYQDLGEATFNNRQYRDMLYYGSDILLSLGALKLPSTKFKALGNEGMVHYTPNVAHDINNGLGFKIHPLFQTSNSDLLNRFRALGKWGIRGEILSNGNSAFSLGVEINKANK